MPNRESFRLMYAMQLRPGSNEGEILLYGEIIQDMPEAWKWSKEDKSAADFDKAVKALQKEGATRLLLRINSPGGIVSEAVAMRSILVNAGFEKIRIRIEGICASAATIPATLPGARVSITPGSDYMLHNPWTRARGNANEIEAVVRYLRTQESAMRALYAAKCGQSDEQLKDWMDAETWFSAEEAVKYGFCDEVVDEEIGDNAEPLVACVSPRAASVMRSLYNTVPDRYKQQEEQPIVSNAPGASLTEPSENKQSKEEPQMPDIKDITREQLQSENPDLHSAIMSAGAEQERARIQEIDDLTMPGYEDMAAQAKASGMSAMDFHKQIIKVQKERGQQFAAARKSETAPAASVTGGAAEESNGSSKDDYDAFAKEMAGYAAEARKSYGGMY